MIANDDHGARPHRRELLLALLVAFEAAAIAGLAVYIFCTAAGMSAGQAASAGGAVAAFLAGLGVQIARLLL